MKIKVTAYIAEFSKTEQSKEEGGEPRIKYCGNVRFLVDETHGPADNLMGLAFRRATQDQLECNVVTIRRDNRGAI